MSISQDVYVLDSVPSDSLLTRLKELVGRSNRIAALLLAHLGEVDARGIYRDHACSSLYAYCTYELRMSEDAAQRRIVAARTARRFPLILEMLEDAALHISGIVLLSPHLTDENHQDLLARARFRSKRDIQKLIADVCPRPDAPALIEPLGPEPQYSNRAPSWRTYVESLAGPVRDIPSGNGPGQAPAPPPFMEEEKPAPPATDSPAPARVEEDTAPPPDATPQRFRIQFTAEQRYVDLLQEARDLLQHQVHDRDIAAVHLRAMEALVEKLRKQRRAETDRPRTRKDAPVNAAPASAAPPPPPTLKHSRHVPAAVVREVWARDQGQCTFVDDRGVRCRETAGLEIQHRQPHALGGAATTENCTLHCRAHNQLAAERDFGTDFMRQRILAGSRADGADGTDAPFK